MKNWTDMAAAGGLGIPAAEMARIVKPLESLETAFRPLAETLTFADEPAAIFDAAEEAE
jgi:hypothetical protein